MFKKCSTHVTVFSTHCAESSEMTEVICLSCGDKIPSSTDRRNICTAATQKVAAIWKIFFRIGLEQCNKVELFDTMFTDKGEVITANNGHQKAFAETVIMPLTGF